jgi:hypothetical protein
MHILEAARLVGELGGRPKPRKLARYGGGSGGYVPTYYIYGF